MYVWCGVVRIDSYSRSGSVIETIGQPESFLKLLTQIELLVQQFTETATRMSSVLGVSCACVHAWYVCMYVCLRRCGVICACACAWRVFCQGVV